MKNYIIIYFLLMIFLSSCGCDVNTEFDKKHKLLIDLYHEGDTIFFSNDFGLLDTFLIVEKSEWVNNCMLSSKSVEIKHLPKNKWIDGYEGTDQGFKPINQSLITIEKEIPPEGYDQYSDYSIYITYRNFDEPMEDSIKSIKDNIFGDIGVKEYIRIKDESRVKNDSLDISEIFWSNKLGLIGYRLYSGNLYKLKK